MMNSCSEQVQLKFHAIMFKGHLQNSLPIHKGLHTSRHTHTNTHLLTPTRHCYHCGNLKTPSLLWNMLLMMWGNCPHFAYEWHGPHYVTWTHAHAFICIVVFRYSIQHVQEHACGQTHTHTHIKLTLQFPSSSADRTMVPHFLPGIPLWKNE